MLVVGVEGLPVDHGVDWVDAFEVSFEENICLEFLGEDGYHFWKTSLTSPIVGERVLRTDTKDV